jgi:hypothetical protein
MMQQTKPRQFGRTPPVLRGLSVEQRHPKGYHHLPLTPPISTQLTVISSITSFTAGNHSTENSEEPSAGRLEQNDCREAPTQFGMAASAQDRLS